jgi:hypothetical protein
LLRVEDLRGAVDRVVGRQGDLGSVVSVKELEVGEGELGGRNFVETWRSC